ncbi:MAG: histone H1 [archaeon]|nr:histone H1 [archaeon]MDA1130083.1 histone H1 [archaeon]
MSVEANVQKMIDDLTAALADAVKHDKGNSAAGTRVRKAMQDVKADAQDIRVQVQNDKNN